LWVVLIKLQERRVDNKYIVGYLGSSVHPGTQSKIRYETVCVVS